MILKCERENKESWRIFDNVHNLKYGYRVNEKLDSKLIEEYSSPDTTTLIWEDVAKNTGNILVLEFRAENKKVTVLTQFTVFLMNDEGKTIERLRY